LSTEDLARSGPVRQDEGRAPDPAEKQAARPRGDVTAASTQGGPPQVVPQQAGQGYEQEAAAEGPRDGVGATAAQRPDPPGPVPDSLGGGAGDQGSMTRPDETQVIASRVHSREPGTATRGTPSPATDRGERPPTDAPGGGGEVALLSSADEDLFRRRWGDAQARFVDDPQEAVRTADGLVAELMQSLAQGFSEHKARLEAQWQRGGDPDTEELRQALQRYRSFFDRLLST
jgi:hypothetical protein